MNTKSFISELKKEVEDAKRTRIAMISEKRRAQCEFNELAETASAVTRCGSRAMTAGRASALGYSMQTSKNSRIQTRTLQGPETTPEITETQPRPERRVTFEAMDIITAKFQSARLRRINGNTVNRVANL